MPDDARLLAHDLADQFDRVRSIADGEAQFLFGVIELYQTKVNTKMTVAMERLAVIAAVTLPVTAIASIYGMNMIVNQHTHVTQLVVVAARDGDDLRAAAALGAPAGLVVTRRSRRVGGLIRRQSRRVGRSIRAPESPGRGRTSTPGRGAPGCSGARVVRGVRGR